MAAGGAELVGQLGHCTNRLFLVCFYLLRFSSFPAKQLAVNSRAKEGSSPPQKIPTILQRDHNVI